MGMIAIIDDDTAVRSATSAMLRSLGYTTASFESAEAFLASESPNKVKCIISDVRMPGMSGIELQKHLIEHGHQLPIIFMTAFPEERERAVAIESGAFGFLIKPFTQNSLVDCLSLALRH
jgi:FixJ family two-component response regulator